MIRARDGQRRAAGRARTRGNKPRVDVPAPSARDLVLVATHDPALRRQLCNKLDHQGYRVLATDTSTCIEEIASLTRPLAILLDLDSLDDQGLTLIGRIREHAAIPTIALSARTSEGDKVAALDAGADDYVLKPFGSKELLARVRVAVRFTRARPRRDEIYAVGPLRIDTARHQVTVDGRSVHLTPIEFQLLELLARYRGATVTRAQLVHEIWGTGGDHTHLVRVHIAALRRKIEPDRTRPRWLITVLNVGYRLRDEMTFRCAHAPSREQRAHPAVLGNVGSNSVARVR